MRGHDSETILGPDGLSQLHQWLDDFVSYSIHVALFLYDVPQKIGLEIGLKIGLAH